MHELACRAYIRGHVIVNYCSLHLPILLGQLNTFFTVTAVLMYSGDHIANDVYLVQSPTYSQNVMVHAISLCLCEPSVHLINNSCSILFGLCRQNLTAIGIVQTITIHELVKLEAIILFVTNNKL